MSLSAEILCRIVGIETDTADIAKNTRVTRAEYFTALSDGTAAGQAQIIWSDKRTVTGTDTLQLSALPDTRDGAAVTVSFTAVKAMYVRNTHATGVLAVQAAAGLLSTILFIQPGGVLLLCNPSDTGNTSGVGGTGSHNISSSVSGTTYEIVIVGEGSVI